MHAAVVTAFSEPPRFAEFPAPVPIGEHEELVDVIASGLHPRVRSQADGSHYTSGDELPLVPGIDGVGRRADGTLVYFVLGGGPHGALAEQAVVDRRRSVPLPDGVDPVLIAAAMNPAMSSWIPLRTRTPFRTGQSVLVLGATGSAGRMALQVARHLGASEVIAAGRGRDRLDALAADGATATIDLSADPGRVAREIGEKAGEVDVVLDYLWGRPAEAALMPLLLARADRSRALDWIQIGSVAGADIALPSAALRQANVRFLGSGQGSVSTAGIVAELPALVERLSSGAFVLDAVAVPLAEVAEAWTAEPGTRRVVLVP